MSKHYEENHHKFEVKMGNVALLILGVFITFWLIENEDFRNQVFFFIPELKSFFKSLFG